MSIQSMEIVENSTTSLQYVSEPFRIFYVLTYKKEKTLLHDDSARNMTNNENHVREGP